MHFVLSLHLVLLLPFPQPYNHCGLKIDKKVSWLMWAIQATFTIVWRRSLRSGRDFFWRFLTHCDDTTFRANVFLLTMWYLLLTNPLGILPPKYRMKFYWTRNIRSKKKRIPIASRLQFYCTMREKREKKPLKKAHQLQREKISRFSATHATLHSGQKISFMYF